MKINGSPDTRSFEAIDRTPGATRSNQSSQPGQIGADSVRFSDLSSQLSSIEQQLATSDEFDAKKVDKIRQAMSDGSFRIDSGVIADRMIAGTKELIGRS